MKPYLRISALLSVGLALVGCSSSSGEASLDSAPAQVTAAESKSWISIELMATVSPKDNSSKVEYNCRLSSYLEPVDKKVKITSTQNCEYPTAATNVHFRVYEINPELEEPKLIADRYEYGFNTDEVGDQVLVNCPSESTLKVNLSVGTIRSTGAPDSGGGVALYECSTGKIVAY